MFNYAIGNMSDKESIDSSIRALARAMVSEVCSTRIKTLNSLDSEMGYGNRILDIGYILGISISKPVKFHKYKSTLIDKLMLLHFCGFFY